MKIVVAGTRGIPDIPGGVETVCEELYPRLAAMGHDVTVLRRSCYLTDRHQSSDFKGVHLIDITCPRKKSLEAIVHTFKAIRKAKELRPDILHIHAIGPSLLIPFAKLLGLKVVMTHHGPDYDRGKWGKMAKTVLKLGEQMGVRFADRVIVISNVIADICAKRCGRKDTNLIFNGVNTPTKSKDTSYVSSLGLQPGRYIVGMGRFVEEKGFHDLVEAYKLWGEKDLRLVLVGDSDHEDAYSQGLKQQAKEAGVVLTGYIKGEKMNQIMTNAALFCMPSYHEGLPIALLEAMSYGLDVLVSDIPSTRLPELNPDDFFPVGDVKALAEKLALKSSHLQRPRTFDLSRYNWDNIAEQTLRVYQEIL